MNDKPLNSTIMVHKKQLAIFSFVLFILCSGMCVNAQRMSHGASRGGGGGGRSMQNNNRSINGGGFKSPDRSVRTNSSPSRNNNRDIGNNNRDFNNNNRGNNNNRDINNR